MPNFLIISNEKGRFHYSSLSENLKWKLQLKIASICLVSAVSKDFVSNICSFHKKNLAHFFEVHTVAVVKNVQLGSF